MNVIQQALEALEYFSDTSNSAMDKAMSEDAITSLRQTIEQAEKQEPVAWRRYEDGMWVYYETKAWDDLQPLYTHPQPKREPLTHEDFLDWYDNAHWGNEDFKQSCERAFEAGWQAAHGIKGEA